MVNFPNETLNLGNFIGGHWQQGSGAKREIYSPLNGQLLGIFHQSTKEDIDRAITAAAQAQKSWGATPIKERSQVLFNFRTDLINHIDEISEIVSLENGKTIAEARAGILKGIEVLEFALSIQNLDLGGRLEVSRGVSCEYRREPLGVVANITPFNFPAMVPMWTIPIAIALGNAYVWKPSDKTPLTSRFIAESFQRAGLPDGILTVLQGGAETVNGIIEHSEIKAVGFVGSSKIASMVYQKAASLGKKVLALGGAKNHIFLLPDANPDLCAGISDSFTGCAGQRCMAASVLLAVGDCEHLIEKIVARAASLELGKDMGAIITAEQVHFLNEAISRAEKAGAKVLLDGRNLTAPVGMEGGNWIGPTVLDHVAADSEASKVELFGPIISIVRCKNLSEAIAIENANEYGNAASVFTTSGALAEQVIKSARTGMVGVNVGVPVPREPFSFGGVNASKFGHGDITGIHSLNLWSDIKKVTTKWEQQQDSNWMS